MLGSVGLPEVALLVALSLPYALAIWAVIDCVKRGFTGPHDKLIWILVVALVPCAGPLLYLVVGQPKHLQAL